ncbi:MAG: AraC family transcriptional regulator [Clostridia bacterium]|nr:AraC family transcriptional regulator [Clostridia bacterium]
MLIWNQHTLSYAGGGLFTTTLPWVHPERTEKTYEIIYMTKGVAHMEENGEPFTLEKGDLKVLTPGLPHRGTKESLPPTEFYWHHFHFSGDLSAYLSGQTLFRGISSGVFPEILHLENISGKDAAEPALLYLLSTLMHQAENKEHNRLANRVLEWTRINADASLTVSGVAKHFGYHPDHLSRLVKAHSGVGLKDVLDGFIITRAKDLLDNSTYSVKEIADMLGFRDANLFVNFYKYHENTTPTRYRCRNSGIHMNAR